MTRAGATGARAPARLVPLDGRRTPPSTLPPDTALLAARVDLDHLVHTAARPGTPIVVDLDEIGGLAPDQRAVAFLLRRLNVAGILTRHLAAARAGAEAGALTFFKVSALDSTGLERALAMHPRIPGLGTAISPGLVLPYLAPAQRGQLPPPVLAYGLVRTREEAGACRRAGADVVLWALTPAAVSG